jgi:hypothetical protein
MIAKRYGRNVESVTAEFNAVAMNEIGFRRDHEWSLPADEFDSRYERLAEHVLSADGEGDTQSEVEAGLLQNLLDDLRAVEAAAEGGTILLVENESGVDYPRLHSTQKTVVVGFENRLYFTYRVDPPLRLGQYRARAG